MFRTRLLLVGLLLIGLLLLMGGLSHWAAAQFQYQLDPQSVGAWRARRVSAAGRANVPAVQAVHGFLDQRGKRTGDNPEIPRLRQEIEATCDRIRALIAREVAHTLNREDEEEELNLLARIERQLQSILNQVEMAAPAQGGGQDVGGPGPHRRHHGT